jgi:uncharacterized membrane protein
VASTETRQEAQARARQIEAFGRELRQLEQDGVLTLGGEQRTRVDHHHAALLAALADRFDVDRSEGESQLSLGMRIASLLGAVALSAGAVLFFYRVWGLLGTSLQVAVLAGVPLMALVSVDLAARREKTLYVASVLALLAWASFVLDLSALGAIFNMTPSPWALLPWAALGLALAYTYGLRLMLAVGLLLGLGFLNALVATSAGIDWSASPGRPEPFLVLGALVFAGSFTALASGRERFPETWRLVGTAALLLPILFLSVWTTVFSYHLLPESILRPVYDAAGFLIPIAAIWCGIRRGWPETVASSTAFLVLFAYAKCFDWWWELMPRYLFFLLLGGLAVAAILLLGRLRRRMKVGVR